MYNFSNVKITSDGTSQGTVITVDGKPIKCVSKLVFKVDADNVVAEAEITVVLPEFEVVGEIPTECIKFINMPE